MTLRKDSFSDEIPPPFGFSTEWRRIIKRAHSWKSKAVVTILCFAVLWVIFHTFGQATASENPSGRKSKRHLEMRAFAPNLDRRMSARDVHIIPEKLGPHFKRGYDGKSPRRGTVGRGKSPSAKPFEATGGERGSGSADITTREKTEEETKFMTGLAKGLISSMRLKGIYMQSMSKGGKRLEEKFNYSEEINNLMQNGFAPDTKDEERTLEGGGAAFKLPEEKGRPRAPSSRGRPITIFLDFHPMMDGFGKEKSSQVDGEGRGMIMKLNLFLGKGAVGGRGGKVKGGSSWAGRGKTKGKRQTGRRSVPSWGWTPGRGRTGFVGSVRQ